MEYLRIVVTIRINAVRCHKRGRTIKRGRNDKSITDKEMLSEMVAPFYCVFVVVVLVYSNSYCHNTHDMMHCVDAKIDLTNWR